MVDINLISMLAGGSVFMGLAVALVMLRQGSLPARCLAAAMIAAILNILHGLLMPAQVRGGISFLTEPLQFALPPLFAAYVRSLLDSAWKPRLSQLWHFLPLAIMATLAIVLELIALPTDFPILAWSVGTWVLLLVQAFAYIRAVIRRISKFRRALGDELSSLRGVDQSWLLWFSRGLHFLYLAYTAIPFVLLHAGGAAPARHLIGLALCLAVGVLAGHQILGGQKPVPQVPATPSRPNATSNWDPELPAALVSAMRDRMLFKDPNLSLGSLAESLGWPRNEVSAAINGHFQQSFYDFINGFRVEEAKRLMTDPASRSFTLLALAMDAGFNSKPTFNAVFKKITGLSPSAWLKQAQ